MQPKRANPAWPADIIEIFDSTMTETPLGCGNCCNADWVSDTDSKGYYFVVSLCSAGIPVKDGTPKEFCTHFQRQPANAVGHSTSAAAVGTAPSALSRPN